MVNGVLSKNGSALEVKEMNNCWEVRVLLMIGEKVDACLL
jgi:hypothetical protein